MGWNTDITRIHPYYPTTPSCEEANHCSSIDAIPWGALDGELPVSEVAYILGDEQVGFAARLILGRAGCRLPVVYVSCGFRGDHIVDFGALASDLSGMAHVVVEATRRFSRSLQTEVNSENVYGGTIGIYWPDGSGRRSFFIGHEYDGAIDIKHAIIKEVRTALMNRRPMFRCTWSAVQESVSKTAYASLKASGSNEVKEYVLLFDSEIEAKRQQLSEAEAEIDRLNNEIIRLETLAAVGTVTLRTGPERDMYDGELREIVRDALQDAVTHVQADSRREHVLNAILQATPKWEATKVMRETLKDILRGYKNMASATRKGLENMGFTIEEQGKHYKLIFRDDDRYTFSLAKSGSDHRGGLNASTDISKRLF